MCKMIQGNVYHSLQDLADLTGVSLTSVWRWVWVKRQLPEPVTVEGYRRPLWTAAQFAECVRLKAVGRAAP